MEQKNHRQCNENGISVDNNGLLEFMMNSHPIFLPEDNVEKRKRINKHFHDSCMFVKVAGKGYLIGKLNWTNATGYSMDVNGEEMQFSYSDTEAIFKHNPC